MHTGKCRHCGRERAVRTRGLCRPCYKTASIRRQYHCLTSGPSSWGFGHVAPQQEIPPVPTQARCGTSAKLAVLMERVQAGVGLWHPNDGLPEEDE